MDSSNQFAGWASILRETAENVRTRIRGALLRRPALGFTELKSLLDSEAQHAVVDSLTQIGASADIISEEGASVVGDGGIHVVVDPVDGTTNLARGVPLAVTSLLASENQRLSGALAGLVMDLYSGEIYRAEREKGAWRGVIPIHPAEPRDINEALISIDISKGASLKPVECVIGEARHLRQLGCAAISLCLVASGVMDAHIDLRGSLRATDVAAGLLILKEAGGVYSVNGCIGGDLEFKRSGRLELVAASSHKMLQDLLLLVEGHKGA